MITALDPRRLKFVDESGVNLAMTRLYGRAQPGERVIGTVPQNYGPNITILGAVGGLTIICATQFVIWTPPGEISIYGVQGRYLTPLVLLLACAIPATKAAHAVFLARHALLIVSVFAPISIIVMLVAVVQRYY